MNIRFLMMWEMHYSATDSGMKIIHSKRVLVKSGSGPFLQEPYNEVIATALHKRLGVMPYTPYELLMEQGQPYSLCENFITKDTELISAYQLINSEKKEMTYPFMSILQIPANPFKKYHGQQIHLVSDFSFMEFSKLRDFDEEAAAIWEQADTITPERKDILCRAVKKQLMKLEELALQHHHGRSNL